MYNGRNRCELAKILPEECVEFIYREHEKYIESRTLYLVDGNQLYKSLDQWQLGGRYIRLLLDDLVPDVIYVCYSQIDRIPAIFTKEELCKEFLHKLGRYSYCYETRRRIDEKFEDVREILNLPDLPVLPSSPRSLMSIAAVAIAKNLTDLPKINCIYGYMNQYFDHPIPEPGCTRIILRSPVINDIYFIYKEYYPVAVDTEEWLLFRFYFGQEHFTLENGEFVLVS